MTLSRSSIAGANYSVILGGRALVEPTSTRRSRRGKSGEIAHAIISRMFEDSRNEQIKVRVIRNGLTEPPDEDWSKASPEERIEAVWTLTELCFAWNKLSASEPRLQRTITRLQRAQR